jgi:hypothetical protein
VEVAPTLEASPTEELAPEISKVNWVVLVQWWHGKIE